MQTFDSASYYEHHYAGTAPSDWTRWNEQGLWPSPASLRPAALHSIEDCHGIVYKMLAPYAPFHRTLDIGCSAGDFILPIRGLSQESYGLDIVPFTAAWEILRAKYGVHCQQHDLDKAGLPFPDRHFSAVTMIMALEHVFNVEHAAQEIARVLAPGGVAVIQVPNLAYVKRRIDLLFGKLPITADPSDTDFTQAWDGQHLHYFTKDMLQKLFVRQGLVAREFRCFGRLAKWRSLWPSLLGADLTVLVEKAGPVV